jgi:transporter family-2 protein
VTLAGTAGLAMATQARINGELAVRLQDGLAAALLSFGVGLALLLLAVTVPAPGRRRLRAVWVGLRAGDLRWWHCLGGVCGGFVVASQGLTVAALGVAVFTVALVAGQSTSSLLVDRSGLAPGGAERVTPARVAGAALCVLAVVVAVADRLGTPRALALAALPLLAGVGIAWQQAVNGRVRAVAGSPWPATFVNFVAGTAALLLGYGVGLAVRGWPAGELPTEPWLYAGGPLGVLVITVAAAVVRFTGVLLLGLAAVAGQVLGALALDLLVPTQSRPALHTYAGAVLALAAVFVAAAPSRRVSWRRRSGPGTPGHSGRSPQRRC